jgi:hypothetical protein
MRRKRGARDSCRCAARRLQDACGAKPPDHPRCTKPTREVEHAMGTSARAFIRTWGHRCGVGPCILPRRRRALRGGWRGSVAGVDSSGFPMRFLAGHCLTGGTSTALKLAKSREVRECPNLLADGLKDQHRGRPQGRPGTSAAPGASFLHVPPCRSRARPGRIGAGDAGTSDGGPGTARSRRAHRHGGRRRRGAGARAGQPRARRRPWDDGPGRPATHR